MDLRLLRYFVAVAEEGHMGRGAARLHMAQPPLGRAIRQLETQVGAPLFERTAQGVSLTTVGVTLLAEARSLLDHADRLVGRLAAAAGADSLVVGVLADTSEHISAELVAAFRSVQPAAEVTVRESDLQDPSAGLRSGLVDVALTRTPFDTAGLLVRTLRSEPLGVVLRADDALADRESVHSDELAGRAWVQLGDEVDAGWRSYWTVEHPGRTTRVRTIQECLQAVLWNGAAALAPTCQPVPDGVVVVPLADRAPNSLVVAWRPDRVTPLVRCFVDVVGAVSVED